MQILRYLMSAAVLGMRVVCSLCVFAAVAAALLVLYVDSCLGHH
jgi:hypothetical protein